jgi:hypothetical protein
VIGKLVLGSAIVEFQRGTFDHLAIIEDILGCIVNEFFNVVIAIKTTGEDCDKQQVVICGSSLIYLIKCE